MTTLAAKIKTISMPKIRLTTRQIAAALVLVVFSSAATAELMIINRPQISSWGIPATARITFGSGAIHDPCTISVSWRIARAMLNRGVNGWVTACEARLHAASTLKLATPAQK